MTHNTTPSYKKVDQRNRPGDLKHCDICDKRSRCILNFNEEVKDEKTGEQKNILRRIPMARINDQRFDKVAQAGGCKNYAHNRFFVYNVLNNYRVLPNWEWKKNKEK